MGISKTFIVLGEGVIFNFNFDIHSNCTKGPLEVDAERILRKYHTKYTPGSFVEF